MESGFFEPTETELVKKLIKDVDILINIGANIGYYVCIGLQNSKKFYAFEPINLNVQYLLKNIKANQWESSVEVYPIALSDQSGIINIYGGGTKASIIGGLEKYFGKNETLVATSTLDNILSGRVIKEKCLIIIDIEGAEFLMLKGASVFINQTPHHIWMIEIFIFQMDIIKKEINPYLMETFKIFWDKGYECWTVEDNSILVTKEMINEIINKKED